MQNYDSKMEIIKAILGQLEIANEIAASTKKILIDFFPYIATKEQIDVLDDLKNRNIIGGFEKRTDFFAVLKPSKSLLLNELNSQNKKAEVDKLLTVARPKAKLASLPIRDIRMNEDNYLLEINGGERFVPFRSRKMMKKLKLEEGLTREEKEHSRREVLKTKQWKVLYRLWDFRWEMKGGKVLQRGDFFTLANLRRMTECETTGAVKQHIKRLNNRFKNDGLSIEIIGENERYRLVINKV